MSNIQLLVKQVALGGPMDGVFIATCIRICGVYDRIILPCNKPHTRLCSGCVLYHILLYRVHIAWVGFKLIMLVLIGTDCICSYKSNYHTITTTTAPIENICSICNLIKYTRSTCHDIAELKC